MPQDISDVFAAHAVVDHLGGDSLPEDMTRAARGDDKPSVSEGLPDAPPDCPMSQGMKWGPIAQQDVAIDTARPPVLEVGYDRLANVVGEGDTACPAGLAGWQAQPTVSPIDIV